MLHTNRNACSFVHVPPAYRAVDARMAASYIRLDCGVQMPRLWSIKDPPRAARDTAERGNRPVMASYLGFHTL